MDKNTMIDISKIQIPETILNEFCRNKAIELCYLIKLAIKEYKEKKITNIDDEFNLKIALNEAETNVITNRYKRLTNLSFIQFTLGFPRKVHMGFIVQNVENKEIFIVFRGTEGYPEWINNFRPSQKVFLPDNKPHIKIRTGFRIIYTRSYLDDWEILYPLKKIYGLSEKVKNTRSIQSNIKMTIEDLNRSSSQKLHKIFITGQSLGAALATIATLDIAYQFNQNFKPILYTFASPRTGNSIFSEAFDDLELKCYRIANSEDIVTNIPFASARLIGKQIMDGASPVFKRRILFWRDFLSRLSFRLTNVEYKHLGVPIYFTKQTGSISENHNLGETYRKALYID